MTIIVGVDPAARRLDAVVLREDGGYTLHKRTMPTDIVERCVTAQRWLEDIVKDCLRQDPDVRVGVEEPVLGMSGRATGNGSLPVAKVHGALLAGGHRAGGKVYPINNRRWKRRIVGNGNATKTQINRWVRRHWGKLWREAKGRQDTCDAACVALEVKEMIRLRRKMDNTRRRAALLRKEAA